MNCPDAQALSRYYDEMLVGEEYRQITQHVLSCEACQRVIALYDGEAKFIKATLREPSLHAQFVEDVLREVKPRKEWRWLQTICIIFLAIIFMAVLLYAEAVS